MLTRQEKIEIFKIIYHPGKEIGKALDESKRVVEWLTDAGGNPDVIKTPAANTKKK